MYRLLVNIIIISSSCCSLSLTQNIYNKYLKPHIIENPHGYLALLDDYRNAVARKKPDTITNILISCTLCDTSNLLVPVHKCPDCNAADYICEVCEKYYVCSACNLLVCESCYSSTHPCKNPRSLHRRPFVRPIALAPDS